MDLVKDNGGLSTLRGLLRKSGLNDTLSGDGAFTLLAPINSAFDGLPDTYFGGLTNTQLTQILQYHIIPGTWSVFDLSDQKELATEQGSMLNFSGTPLVINNSTTVTGGDVAATNGMVHYIDTVLTLPDGFKQTYDVPECDAKVASYAAVCCPVDDPAFLNFCKDLLERFKREGVGSLK